MPTFCEAAESSGLLVESVQVQDLTYHHVDAMERLSDLWGKFSLSESEGSRYQVRDEQGEEEYFIAARFFTRRTISAEAIARTFRLVWRTKKGFEVRDMGNHRVLFVFTNEEDVARVMQGEPGSFDKHLVALKRVEKHVSIQNVIFDRTTFWIQVHNIPIRSATMAMAKEIVSLAGEVVEEVADEGQQDKYNFLRIRVILDLTKPLCRGRRITTAKGGDGWVSFRYECLPIMCYGCGMLTHNDRDCTSGLRARGSQSEGDKQFGSWLRASTPHPYKKSVIRVEGFEDDSEVEETAGSGVNVNGHGCGSMPNGGTADRDGGESMDERRNNHGNIPVVNEDHVDVFQEGPNFAHGIMAGAELTGVNVLKEVNRMNVGADSEAGFQAQLEEIDNALKVFETAGGRTVVGPDRDQVLGGDGLGQMGHQEVSFGPLNSNIDQAGGVGLGGSCWTQKNLSKVSSRMNREPMKLKRNLRDYLGEESHAVSCKKNKSATDIEISVEAGSQPRRTQ